MEARFAVLVGVIMAFALGTTGIEAALTVGKPTSPLPLISMLAQTQSAAAGVAAAGDERTLGIDGRVAGQGKRKLGVDDVFALERISGLRVSPDGETVAYVLTTTTLADNQISRRIWMVPLAGGEPIPMTAEGGSVSEPRFSPDGRYLSFLSSRSGSRQVWLLSRLGGEAMRLTAERQEVIAHEWSPDSSRLMLLMKDPQTAALEARYGTCDGGLLPPPMVIDRKQFKQAGGFGGYLDSRWSHLYVFDLATGETRQITSGDDADDSLATWSPDGHRIAFVRRRGDVADYNTDIWVVKEDNRDQGRRALQLTTNPGPDGSPSFGPDGPAWSPDSRWIEYATRSSEDWRQEFYAQSEIALILADGGEPTILTGGLDRETRAPRFSADGSVIEFQLFDSGTTHLASIGIDDGRVRRLIEGARVVLARDTAAGATVAMISEPHMPGNLFVRESDGSLRQLTRHNDDFLSSIELAEVEKIRSRSPDGTEVEAILFKPPSRTLGIRAPALLWCHAGPVSQFDLRFNIEGQVLAANGYVVVMTNPRGSYGRGNAYAKSLWRRNGELDVQDALSSIEPAVELGYADPERLGVGGWSYGGQLTNYIISETDRFKAAVAGASVALIVSSYGHDSWLPFYEREFGHPWDPSARELYDRYSRAFYNVEDIATPTLFMGGSEDLTTPIIHGEAMYQAMKIVGRTDTRLIVYVGEGHSIAVPAYRRDQLERYVAWFDKYLKNLDRPPG